MNALYLRHVTFEEAKEIIPNITKSGYFNQYLCVWYNEPTQTVIVYNSFCKPEKGDKYINFKEYNYLLELSKLLGVEQVFLIVTAQALEYI